METNEKKNLTTNIVVLLMFCGTLISSWQWNKYFQEQRERSSSSNMETTVEETDYSDEFIVVNGGMNLPSTVKLNSHGTIITSRGIISDGVFTPME